jgi:hypothetical protein
VREVAPTDLDTRHFRSERVLRFRARLSSAKVNVSNNAPSAVAQTLEQRRKVARFMEFRGISNGSSLEVVEDQPTIALKFMQIRCFTAAWEPG